MSNIDIIRTSIDPSWMNNSALALAVTEKHWDICVRLLQDLRVQAFFKQPNDILGTFQRDEIDLGIKLLSEAVFTTNNVLFIILGY
jgi:hypothetical protein